MGGVLPAHQRLHAEHLTGAEVGLGLVVQHQLVAFQRLPQPAEQREPWGTVLVDRGVGTNAWSKAQTHFLGIAAG